MTLLAAAASVLLSVSDPQGDAFGDGGYSLPAAVDPSLLDLRSFTVLDDGGRLQLRLGMARQNNQAGAPNGFSEPAVEVYIGRRGDPAGDLGPTGFRTPPSSGWRYRLRLNGWAARLEVRPDLPALEDPAATGQDLRAAELAVSVDGADIVVATPIAAGDYEYWAFVGLYDPLTPDGLRRPVGRADALTLASSLPQPPVAIDLLSETSQARYYDSREAAPVGRPPENRSAALLLTGLAGACMALGATVWGLFRR